MRTIYQNFVRNFFSILGYLLILLSSAHAGNSCTYTPKVFQGYFNAPNQITTDGVGNVWVRNFGDKTITKISVTNPDSPVVYQGTSHKFGSLFSMAADLKGNLWILNIDSNNVTKLPVENPDTPVVYGVGPVQAPKFMTVDSNENVWVIDDLAQKLIKLPKNTPHNPVEISWPGFKISLPMNMIADNSGDIWIQDLNRMTVFNLNGPLLYFTYSGSKYQFPRQSSGMATDLDSNFYITDSLSNRVIKIIAKKPAADPVIFSDSLYQFNNPFNVATDPQGNIWVASFNSVTEIPADSPAVPIIFSAENYQFGELGGLTVDVKGNIWLLNITLNTVTKLILSQQPC